MANPIATRLLGSVRRALVRLVDDDGTVQKVQVEARSGESIPDVDHLQPYGLTGNPPLGARTLLLMVGGAWDHVVALATGHTDRPTGLGAGDVTVYSGHDARLDLRDDGTTVKGPQLVVEGDLHVDGDSTTDGNTTVEGYTDSGDGFKVNGTPGLTGTITVTVTPPGSTLFQLTLKGGIVTGYADGGACPVANGTVLKSIKT